MVCIHCIAFFIQSWWFCFSSSMALYACLCNHRVAGKIDCAQSWYVVHIKHVYLLCVAVVSAVNADMICYYGCMGCLCFGCGSFARSGLCLPAHPRLISACAHSAYSKLYHSLILMLTSLASVLQRLVPARPAWLSKVCIRCIISV